MKLHEWLAQSIPMNGIRLTAKVSGEEVEFRMHFEPYVIERMLRKAAKNRSQACTDGPIEVRYIGRRSDG
jgi:hypothetical protein